MAICARHTDHARRSVAVASGFIAGIAIVVEHANIDKLQRVQNILVQVVVGAPWTSSLLNIRRDLHLVTCWSSYCLQTVSHHLENTSYLSASLPV